MPFDLYSYIKSNDSKVSRKSKTNQEKKKNQKRRNDRIIKTTSTSQKKSKSKQMNFTPDATSNICPSSPPSLLLKPPSYFQSQSVSLPSTTSTSRKKSKSTQMSSSPPSLLLKPPSYFQSQSVSLPSTTSTSRKKSKSAQMNFTPDKSKETLYYAKFYSYPSPSLIPKPPSHWITSLDCHYDTTAMTEQLHKILKIN